MSATFSPSCVWHTTPQLLLALEQNFGDPLDTYVNGSQVWLREDGPEGLTVEYRLHPVAGYQRPSGLETAQVFWSTTAALAAGAEPPAPITDLWDGLEAFPAHQEDIEPAPLAALTGALLGIEPDAFGLVDHSRIGDQWERSRGSVSIVGLLLEQLQA